MATTSCKGGVINCDGSSSCNHFRLTFCVDFQSKTCSREQCNFLHVSRGEQLLYKQTGKLTNNIFEESIKKNQYPGACLDYVTKKTCPYNNCSKLHYNTDFKPLKCPVCLEEILKTKLCTISCNHIICKDCSSALDTIYGSIYSVRCPICRREGDVLELS